MVKRFHLCPSIWLGALVACSLAICWVMSMQRIDFVTWTIGPGRGGDQTLQLGMSNGSANLFLGESGFSREPGLYYDSRVFASDEVRSTWLPQIVSIDDNGSGLTIEIAIWFLLLACLATWVVWVAWRSSNSQQAKQNAGRGDGDKPSN